MKSVLISIQPYWVFLIIAKKMGWNINQEKSVEVRKNYPKAEDWNKVVKIYCSKDKKSFAKIPKEYQPFMEQFLGKVIGEFVCDKIFEIKYCCGSYCCKGLTIDENDRVAAASKLSLYDMRDYLSCNDGYGWNISDLVIYDKPRELGEFVVEGDCLNGDCKKCKWFDGGNDYNVEADCLLPYDFHFKKAVKPLFRPPQSWCYVESGSDTE